MLSWSPAELRLSEAAMAASDLRSVSMFGENQGSD
jgi:hypothetical protein